MSYVLSVIAFIVIFSVLVLVHEFGHFIMAKKAGIKVEEFGFGLPPRLWGKRKGETIYSINWIPFGGFVRMYGEEGKIKAKRSFAAQPMRARVLVIVAGVVMNFLLAWLLMFIGFTVGMKPIIQDLDGFFKAVDKGQIVLHQGVVVKTVEEGTIAAQAGFKRGDIIYAIDGKAVNFTNIEKIAKNSAKFYGVVRNDEQLNIQVAAKGEMKLGLVFDDFNAFPRVRIFNLKSGTALYDAGLRSDDVILSVNGQQIFTISEYESSIKGKNQLKYSVYRGGQVKQVILENRAIIEHSDVRRVIIDDVLPDSPAEKGGLENEDIVVAINGVLFSDSQDVVNYIQEHRNENLAFDVERLGQKFSYKIKPEEGRAGILLAELRSYENQEGISVYNSDQIASLIEVKNEQYPFYVAIYKSLGTTWKMSVSTARMFVSFVGGLLRSGEVPENVSGPIGIAKMTHGFVQEGWMPLLGFVAMLSLSLAVINILPFPALDGGRLLFIIIELVIGRRVNPKWENRIHVFGYFLIMLLILVVTYSDIVRLIK